MEREQFIPEPGDLLLSGPTASAHHELSIMPSFECVLRGRHDRALALGFELARQLRVDLWTTQDHVHFLRLVARRGEEHVAAEPFWW